MSWMRRCDGPGCDTTQKVVPADHHRAQMTEHLHSTYVEGCFRCDLSRDERPTWTVELPGYRKPPLSQNVKMHWAVEQKARRQLIDDTLKMARFYKLPKGLQRVSITLHYRPSTIRQRDEDNLAPTLKACADALVMYGLVPDDSSTFVTSGSRIDPVRRNNPALYLVIEDLSTLTRKVT